MNGFLNVLSQGQRHKPAKAVEVGIVDELASSPEEMLAKAREWIAANPDAKQPWDQPKYRIPGGTPSTPVARRDAARVPGQPAQDPQGRPDARPAQHPVRSGRGHPGRLRHRAAHRGPLLRRARVRSGLEEHDQGVLLRPQRDQCGRLAAGRVRQVHAAQGCRARRRDDGRGHRVRVRAVGLGGRAQGRLPGGRGEGQDVLRGPGREGRQARAHHPRRRARPCWSGSPRPPTTTTSRAATSSSRPSSSRSRSSRRCSARR